MWKLQHVSAHNIVSFKKLELDIEQGVATLVFGQNLDNSSQTGNGSGKSSLIEAISLGLVGDTLRRVKTEEIINDYAEEADVTLILENDYDNTRLEIVRRITRKDPQYIECHKYDADDNEIEKDKTFQPSVADYNRYILDEMGLSKDDIYGNYILCSKKYKSFLEASDREKKEIINRFSNGAMVDESIEKLMADITPVEAELKEKEMKVVLVSGKIEAVNDQIQEASRRKEEMLLSRGQHIQSLKGKISDGRAQIRETNEKINAEDGRLDLIEDSEDELEAVEKSDISLTDAYHKVSAICEKATLGAITNYDDMLRQMEESLNGANAKLTTLNAEMVVKKQSLEKVTEQYHTTSEKYKKLLADNEAAEATDNIAIQKLQKDIDALDDTVGKLQKSIRNNMDEYNKLDRQRNALQNLLHGTITCPKCGHEFLLKSDKSLTDVKKEVAELADTMSDLNYQVDKMNAKINDEDKKAEAKEDEIDNIKKKGQSRAEVSQNLHDECMDIKRQMTSIENDIADVNDMIVRVRTNIQSLQDQLKNIRQRMFDEVFSLANSALDAGEARIKSYQEDIVHCQAMIEQYQHDIEELEQSKTGDIEASLLASKKQYEKDLGVAMAEKNTVQAQYDQLKLQEAHFIEFKSHLANQKIDAIAAITNTFLERIGSDIRVEFEGFKKLKSGKIRDKINIKLLRDGFDCGSFEKFSAGERCRVELANILALHELTNVSCENGRGLDLLCVDEILDVSDDTGLESYCRAINQLEITCMIVTHVPTIEGYPHRLIINKLNGESTIHK